MLKSVVVISFIIPFLTRNTTRNIDKFWHLIPKKPYSCQALKIKSINRNFCLLTFLSLHPRMSHKKYIFDGIKGIVSWYYWQFFIQNSIWAPYKQTKTVSQNVRCRKDTHNKGVSAYSLTGLTQCPRSHWLC